MFYFSQNEMEESMQEQNFFKLISKSKIFRIPSEFPSLTNVNPHIYSALIKNKEYKVKSNVNSTVFVSFINHWVYNKTPDIRLDNFDEYCQLSQEFDRMDNIVQLFKKLIPTIKFSYLKTRNQELKKENQEKTLILSKKTKKYQQIIHFLFTNKGIDTTQKFIKLKYKLFDVCMGENPKFVDYLTRIKVKQPNGLSFVLNNDGKTCSLFRARNVGDLVMIPRSIEYKSNEYLVTKILGFCFELAHDPFCVEFEANSEIKTIEKCAFIRSGIECILIPSPVSFIGNRCFMSCYNLHTVAFAVNSKLRYIDRFMFTYSTIKNLSLPSSIVDFDIKWCMETFKFTSFDIVPNSVQNFIRYENDFIIGKSFENQENYDVLVFALRDIEKATIPSFIKEIKPYAFEGCSKLESVDFSQAKSLEIIGDYSFANTAISKIVIPSNVKVIGQSCFSKSKLEKVEFASKSQLQTICEYAFDCFELNNVSIPSSVIELQVGWLTSKAKVKISPTEVKNIKIYKDGLIIGKSDPNKDNYNVLLYAQRNIISASIPSFIEIISPHAFCDCKKLTKVQFANDSQLKIIGNSAFCSTSIKNIIIPKNVTQIAKKAFYNCSELESIDFAKGSKLEIISKLSIAQSSIQSFTIPSNVSKIEEEWCSNTPNFKDLNLASDNKNFIYYNNELLLGKSDDSTDNYDVLLFTPCNVTNFEIPSFVTKISSETFYNHQNLHSITFSEDSQLKYIGKRAFEKSTLSGITIPSHVKVIDESAFSGCLKLHQIQFAKDSELEIIGANAFSYIQNEKKKTQSFVDYQIDISDILERIKNKRNGILNHDDSNLTPFDSIVIPANVRIIGDSVFYKSANLTKVEFEENSKLTDIGNYSFSETSIRSISFPPHLERIGYRSFNKCQMLHEVIFQSNFNLKIIEAGAFIKCPLKEIIIPSSVEIIEESAFCKCRKLETVEFQENSKLKLISDKAFKKTSITSLKIPSSVEKIDDLAFGSCEELQNIEFPIDSKLTIISPLAFKYSSIQSITIPANAIQCCQSLFEGVIYLTDIHIIPNKEQNVVYYKNKIIIGKSCANQENYDVLIFARRNIRNLVIPSFIKEIKPFAFEGCKCLKHVDFSQAESLEIIGDFAFVDSSIRYMHIPSKIKQISYNCFASCFNLVCIEFAQDSQLQKICDYAFNDCKKLEKIKLPKNSELKYIGSFAFAKTRISSFVIPPSVEKIEGNCFESCNQLKMIEIDENTRLTSLNSNEFSSSNPEFMIPNKIKNVFHIIRQTE